MVTAGLASILLINDEPDTQAGLVARLHEQGWRVDRARGGKFGQQRAQILRPDLILINVRKPGMDGFATCRQLREAERTRATPVIFLSAGGSIEDRLTGFECGCVDFMVKPCAPAEVVARVRVHLRLSAARPRAVVPASAAILSYDEVILRAAIHYLGAHLAHLPSLSDIAQSVGTHDKRLSALFRKHLGVTVFAWVREERLRLSRDLLRDPAMSMAQIAERVGFHSAANFATAFRKCMGVAPSQYRACAQHSAWDGSAETAHVD